MTVGSKAPSVSTLIERESATAAHTLADTDIAGRCCTPSVAAAAGAMGQSKAIVAACEGIARNPGAAGAIRLAMIIGLALIESLVIYALIIALLLVLKVGA